MTSKTIDRDKNLEELKNLPNEEKEKYRTKCEIYSRVVGYLRPVEQWNEGKREEFKERKEFKKDSFKGKK